MFLRRTQGEAAPTMSFFDEPMPDVAVYVRALLLALLRDRRPGDEAYPALAEAAESYLRLNPGDAEMKEARDGFVGRPVAVERCAHNGLLLVEPAEDGCAVHCALCGTVGPVRDTSETARKALLVLGSLPRG
jgi:hypothetical protein